jgi:hypothetical protein
MKNQVFVKDFSGRGFCNHSKIESFLVQQFFKNAAEVKGENG